VDGPCLPPNVSEVGWVVFVVLAILSHSRGAVLLSREFRTWFRKRRIRD